MTKILVTVTLSILANLSIAQNKITQHFYFASDSFNLTKSHQPTLDYISSALKANPYYRIRIDGNTDDEGDRDYNLELSKKRVRSIQVAFAQIGLKQNRIQTQAKGEDWPAFTNATEQGKSKNRRVDVYILLDKDSCFKDGCAQTCIPKGTFDPYFTNEIEIKFYPITNVEQMRTNNISAQTVDGGYLFSSGMLRITATYKGNQVNPQKPVKVRIPAYKMDPTFTIYEGASSGNSAVNWKEKKMEIIRGKGDCAYFEIDGSLINKWVNIDKPRPPGNMICVDNPFSYLEMPAIDNDTSKVIENDIVLSFPKTAFESDNFQNVEIKSERVNTLCEMLALRMTSKTTDNQFIDKKQDILSLSGFALNGVDVEPNMKSFTAYFPATKENQERDFYVSKTGENNELLWAYAGKADSIYSISGCDCKFLVKQFDYPTSYINLTSIRNDSKTEITQHLYVKKCPVKELYVYNKFSKNLSLIQAQEDGHFEVEIGDKPSKVVVIGQYENEGKTYVFDGNMTQFRKRWFKNERIVKPKTFTEVDMKQGLKLKNVSCRTPM